MTLIVTALVAGAAAGTSNAASTAVTDLYTGLRDAVKRRLATRRGDAEADALLQDAPEGQLRQALTDAGAGEDNEIVTAAQHVLAHLDLRGAKGVQIGNHNIQHNTFS